MESPSDKNIDLLKEGEIEEKPNLNNQIIQKSNSPLLKLGKRRNSLILKSFKISSNNIKTQKIFNNISEKTNKPKQKNNSMNKLSKKTNKEDNITIKIKDKIEENNTRDKINKIRIKEEIKKLPQTNSFLFKSIIDLKKGKSRPKLLDEQWQYEKILLDYNIIDFTCKKIKKYKF